MFDKEYVFRGKHAEMVDKLTAALDDSIGALFSSNYDVYAVAPIVGLMYNRKADIDKDAAKVYIPADKMNDEKAQLQLNYRMVIMQAFKDTKTLEERTEMAFNLDDGKFYDKLYDSYVLGGVEVIYDKLFTGAGNVLDIMKNMYDFFEEVNSRYYLLCSQDEI